MRCMSMVSVQHVHVECLRMRVRSGECAALSRRVGGSRELLKFSFSRRAASACGEISVVYSSSVYSLRLLQPRCRRRLD